LPASHTIVPSGVLLQALQKQYPACSNRCASEELNIYLNGCRINHDPCPVYPGVSVSLDRSLTFRQHAKTAAKIKSRNNIIAKLAGISWGANAQTLQSSAVALCYSVAEYCVPMWGHSSHVKLVDRQLNEAMRIMSNYTSNCTSVASSIIPHCSSIHQMYEATVKFIDNIQAKPQLPVYLDIFHHPVSRLQSRPPTWSIDSVFSGGMERNLGCLSSGKL